jgi:hypothetical protein
VGGIWEVDMMEDEERRTDGMMEGIIKERLKEKN